MKRKKTKRFVAEEELAYKNIIVYTITVFLVLFPFCVYSHVEKLSELAQKYFPNTKGYAADFFLYHKEKFLIVFAVWVVLFFIGEHIYPEHPFKEIPLKNKKARVTLCFIGIYTLCVIASTIFAADKKTALWGSGIEYEGMAALLSYVVLFLAGYNYFRLQKHRKILKYGLVTLMSAISILAIIEFLYRPIYEIGFMKYLIAPAEYREMAASLSNQEYVGKVTLSFYNPGYLGGLCSMLIPISFGMAYEETVSWKKALYLLLQTGLWITLLGTGVTGPFIAAVIGMGILFLALRTDKKKLFTTIGGVLLFLAAVFLLTNICTGGKAAERIFAVAVNEEKKEEPKEKFVLTDMELNGNLLQVSSKEKTFYMKQGVSEYLVLETLKFWDKTGTEIPVQIKEDGKLYLQSKGYEAVSLSYENEVLSMDLGYADTVDFYVTENGFALVGQNGAALDQIPKSQIHSEELEKLYPLATGRGYMWVNTVPILKECLLIGKGPGNFAFSFPQNDVAGLLNTHGSYKFVVDKPHNWYLQIAVNTGLISLVAIFGILILYFGRGTYEYCIHTEKKEEEVFEKALWAGLFAFCVSGLVNDSIVAVNPIFWLLLGIGSCAVDNRERIKNNRR